jgi:hypothetical protein
MLADTPYRMAFDNEIAKFYVSILTSKRTLGAVWYNSVASNVGRAK